MNVLFEALLIVGYLARMIILFGFL